MIGENIKRIRKKRKITQIQLAKMCGLTNDYISKLELGKRENPSSDVISKIAEALNCSVDELISGEAKVPTIDDKFKKLFVETADKISRQEKLKTVSQLLMERMIKEKLIDDTGFISEETLEILRQGMELDAKLNSNLKNKKGSK